MEKEKSERNKHKTHQLVIVLLIIHSHNLPLKNSHPVISNSRVQIRISEAVKPLQHIHSEEQQQEGSGWAEADCKKSTVAAVKAD